MVSAQTPRHPDPITSLPSNLLPAQLLPAQGDLPGQTNLPTKPVRIKLSILMPAYNEAATIAKAVASILRTDYPCEFELIVVDDGSTDATTTVLSGIRDDRLRVHRHDNNMGKGAALLSAASLATGTHVLPFDADLEYEPQDIPRILEPVLRGRSNVVYGTRLFGCNTVYTSYRYAVGNRFLTRLANILFDSYISDLHTCLKLMPLTMLKELNLRRMGFGLDTEVTAALLKQGVRPFEVPISYYSRTHADGKKISWRDAIECAWILLRIRITRRHLLYTRQAAYVDAQAPSTRALIEVSPVAKSHTIPESRAIPMNELSGG